MPILSPMPSHAAASLAGLLLACSIAQACAAPPRKALDEALEATERAQNAAKTANEQRAAIGSQAERAVRDIERAVDRLRAAIAAAETARPPRPSRLAVSDARRAIVVANVALQKAREALGGRDYAAVEAACAGVLEQLSAANTALTQPASPAPRRQEP